MATLISVALCACSEIKLSTGKEKEVLIDVEGVTSSIEDAYFCLMETIYNYQNDLGTGYFWEAPIGSQNMKEYIKESVKDELTRITAGAVLADKKAVYLTEDEQENVKLIAKKAFENVSKNFSVANINVTEENAYNVYLKRELYNKMFDALTLEAKDSISKEDTKVIVVNYVELPIKTTSNDANELWQKVKESGNLVKTCEDAGYKVKRQIKLSKGMMNSSFDEVAFLLLDNEISEVVESKDGLYIIECVNDDVVADSTASYNMAVHQAQDQCFDEVYNEFSKETHMYFNNNLWKKIDIDKLLK